MDEIKKTQTNLDKKLKSVIKTEPSYDLFVAIHGFVKHIEFNPVLLKSITLNIKANRENNILAKYTYLKQIHQGIEDLSVQTNVDLGHARYAMIKDLNKIKKLDLSESNTLWKKRELSKKIAGEIHARISEHLTKLEKNS